MPQNAHDVFGITGDSPSDAKHSGIPFLHAGNGRNDIISVKKLVLYWNREEKFDLRSEELTEFDRVQIWCGPQGQRHMLKTKKAADTPSSLIRLEQYMYGGYPCMDLVTRENSAGLILKYTGPDGKESILHPAQPIGVELPSLFSAMSAFAAATTLMSPLSPIPFDDPSPQTWTPGDLGRHILFDFADIDSGFMVSDLPSGCLADHLTGDPRTPAIELDLDLGPVMPPAKRPRLN